MLTNHKDTISEFLNTPLNCADKILDRFAALPGAIVENGEGALQRYVCIPGTRKDRVVLVAHTDTVWDKAYKPDFSENQSVIFENGVFKGTNSNCGIGADDRAGCAMLWALRECGHTILIVDGEEHGKHGARYLKKTNKKLYAELNRHRYMLELDWKGTNCALFNQVDNTKKFRSYIENDLGFADSKAPGGTDLAILCRDICGANLGVGYHGWHKSSETLVLAEWENTLQKLTEFLKHPQQRFPTKLFSPYIKFIRRCAGKLLRILKIKK